MSAVNTINALERRPDSAGWWYGPWSLPNTKLTRSVGGEDVDGS